MNTMDLDGKKLLIRPEVAESANKANVIVGEPRKGKEGDKVLGRQSKSPSKILHLGGNRKRKKILVLNLSNPRV